MKERLININLTNEVQPKSIELNGADWIGYGDGEYKNNYPQYLIDLYNNSATNSAIINATASMIAGEDFIVEDSDNLEQYVALKMPAHPQSLSLSVIKCGAVSVPKKYFGFPLMAACIRYFLWVSLFKIGKQ